MDLSALMTNVDVTNLNDDLAALSPSGESVFKTPFGESTAWRTKIGTLSVSFIFDPKEVFTVLHNVASIKSDYIGAIRDGLTTHLLDETDIAPKVEPVEARKWREIVSQLPDRTLTNHVFSDKKNLDEYITFVSKHIEEVDTEEKKLMLAMTTTEFRYHYAIAIDAYPDTKLSTPDEKERRGVLHFYIEGVKGDVTDSDSESTRKTKSSGDNKLDEEKYGGTGYEGKMKELEKRLHLGDTKWTTSQHLFQYVKEFPETAELFFGEFGRWFHSQLEVRGKRLQNSQTHNMYQ
eukprot:CFRG7923T1